MPRPRFVPPPIPLRQGDPPSEEEEEEADDDDVVEEEEQEKQQQEQDETDDDEEQDDEEDVADDEEEEEEEGQAEGESPKAVKPSGKRAPNSPPSSSNQIARAEEEEEGEEEETHGSDSTIHKHPPTRGRGGSENSKRNSVSVAAASASGKRKRSKKEGPEDVSKRPFFQRLWSEDDEIVILSGILDYTKRGGDPFTDSIGFFNSIKRSLHFDANLHQLKLKIRKLKKRFETISIKAKDREEDPVLSKPHDQKLYGLYKQIWVSKEGKSKKNVEGGKMNKNNKEEDEEECRNEKSDGVVGGAADATPKSMPMWRDLLFSQRENESTIVLPSLVEKIVKERTNLLGRSQLKELDSRWRMMQVAEIETYLKRIEFVHEQGTLALKALKSSHSYS